MKFAHLADCHIGSWRDPKLNNISSLAFCKAVDLAIEKNVDFIVISGDLFNTSLPSIDKLKEVTIKFKELQDKNICIYYVAGSHDFSPSGKTMLDVLESAGLCVNVAKGDLIEGKLMLKFTVDKKTGAKLTGLPGKRGGLEKSYYEELNKDNLESESGFKIFLFHSLLSELKPIDLEKVDSHPISLLPKNQDYYAGGHPHFVFNKEEEGFGLVAYPGPLFPNNFAELEKLGKGGFYIYEDGRLLWEPIVIYNVSSFCLDCDHLNSVQVEHDIQNMFKGKEFDNNIVTLRLKGTLESGKPSDINFKDIFETLYDKGAYFVMKNTNALVSKEFEEIKVDAGTVEDVEGRLIKEHLGQVPVEGLVDESQVTQDLMHVLSNYRAEGEKVADFEVRIKSEVESILNLH